MSYTSRPETGLCAGDLDIRPHTSASQKSCPIRDNLDHENAFLSTSTLKREKERKKERSHHRYFIIVITHP